MTAAVLSNVIEFPHRGRASDAAALEHHRQERARRLERENEMLRGEHDRALLLLGLACKVIAKDQPLAASDVMEGLAALVGTNLSRPAWVEHRERRRLEAQGEMVLRVLRETRA